MSGDTVLGWLRVFLPLTLIWIISSSTVECQECSTSGLNVFGGYQYFFYHGGQRTFSETRALCQSLGGDLPIITSDEQNDFIAGKLKTNSDGGHYYIGLEDMDQDSTYRWIDGTVPGYTNWDSPLYGELPPHCAVMRSRLSLTDLHHGRWNLVACTSKRRHICQRPIDVECRWQQFGESQYLIKSTPHATPSDARETCQSYGGDLAIIKTAEVNTFVKELLPPYDSSYSFLCYLFGLRRVGSEDFTWLDDTTLQYNDWYDSTEPSNADYWGCLSLRDGPSWYGQSSYVSVPYICERTRVYDGSNEASFGGLDYFISPSWLTRSFSDARMYCQYHGADLALIKSHDINTFLHGRILGSNSLVYFGLTDQAVEGTFKWIDETPLQYSAWRDLEPNNELGDENCAALSSDLDMRWLDIPCNLKKPFICERYQDVPEYKWTRLNGTLYYISQSSMTSYSFARMYCQAQGGDLAQPKTDKINLHLIELAGGNSYWFGLDDINQEGTFQWIDGIPLDNNGFPSWSDGDATLFENERCVHQQVNNGWRKRRCTSYLRFACEKPPSPRQILPVRLMAATPSPYGGGPQDASFICLLGSENEEIITFSTRRLVRLTEAITSDSYTAPGVSDTVSPVLLRQTLPDTKDGLGFFECSAVTASRMTFVPLGILISSRQLQPSDGRFTKTITIGDDITLNVTNTTEMVQVGGIQWRKFTDVDWANSLIGMSSGSLSHTIQSASVSDAGVYVTYMEGAFEQHQFSLIRLIVTECPSGSWNPPLCDRLCDNCYNGGVCHELSGTCICPPGYAGKNCLQACGSHTFGWDCEFECGTDHPLDKCAGSQICLPDPYGCTCLAGYTGIYCNETCTDGMFGADCLQKCHCTNEADCDNVTGECPGDCSQGWSGSACQVPSVCPNGYFGTKCTQKCNCMNGTPCLKDSGYCDEVEGQCDLGYITDSVKFPANCMTFSGCFSSCLKTCHCSGGVEDCNFLTGDCLSSTCHPRWMGYQCQTDRFETSLEKTNPGVTVAIFSCSFTASSGQTLSSDYVKAAVGRSFTEPWITHVSSNTSGTTINNSYIHKYMGPEEQIYCFVGEPDSSSEFAFVRLPPRDFFVLPSYNGVPELLESGSYHAVIGWRQWDPSSDTGDGPIVGYKIYVRSDNIIVLTKEVQPSSMVNNTDRSVSKRSAENATEMVMYNVSGLEAGSTYSVHIAAIRDGINGEGAQGAALTFTTEKIVPTTAPNPSTVSTPVMIGQDEGGLGGAPIAAAAGGAVGAILLILIIIIVVIIVFKRRRNDSNPSKKGNVEDQYQATAGFHDTSLEGNDYSGHDSVSNPAQTHSRSTRPKPAVVVKPFVRATKSLDLDSTDGSPERSSNKALATRQPIPMAQFPAFVNKNRHTALFSQEFHDLPGPDIYPQTVAREKINFTKNRYKNILPYDSARVKLDVIDNDPHSDYFNASYIPSFDNDKAYIASQGPNNASMDDFWRMVWQENVTTIAMVTKLQEGDKIKCRQYWPNEEGDSVVFGNIKLELVSLEACTGGVKRKMGMRKGDDYRTVTQFHFTEWPDKGVPKHTSSLLQFIKEVRADHGQNTHPLIIHCSAGVGRSGVVISIDSVVDHAKRTRMVDVFNFVTNIRQKRPYMVQTQEQYAFIYGAVLEDLLWRNTLIPVIHFTDHLQDLHTSVGGSGRSKMTKEFETLKSLCPDPPPSRTRSGRTPDNQPKNRYGNNLPLQRNRVILDSPDQDYINASQMKGVHCTFMTTQMPLPTTVSDFWSMVVGSKPSTIVMLNDKSQNDKSCAQYWPDADSAQFGSYSVATLSTSSDGDVTTRQLKVTRNSNASHTVTQYQFHGWPKHGSDQQLGARSLMKLIRAVKSSTNNKKEFSILVHCLSGAGRTGVFCTAMECIAQIAEGNSVDIFQTVKILRADRMQFVQTEEEYAFVYDVIREYLHTENYEQLPYPKLEDHTYGNVEIDYRTLDPEENPYEVTDPQEAGAAALVYGNVETERSQDRPKPKPQQQCSIYENFEFES